MAVNLLRIGSLQTDTPSGIIPLFSGGCAAGNYSSFITIAGAAGYQTTAGKTLYITKISAIAGTAAGGIFSLGYGDNDVGSSAAGAPTNYKIGNMTNILICTAANTYYTQDYLLAVPATKFVSCRTLSAAASTQIVIWGFEL